MAQKFFIIFILSLCIPQNVSAESSPHHDPQPQTAHIEAPPFSVPPVFYAPPEIEEPSRYERIRAPFYWGISFEFEGALALGDERYVAQSGKEFTHSIGVGGDVSFDIGQYVQIGLLFRMTFGGLNPAIAVSEIACGHFAERSNFVQGGGRFRFFPFEFHSLRPFVSFELLFSSLGVRIDSRSNASGCESSDCDGQNQLIFTQRYKALTMAPGIGLRYDLQIRNLWGTQIYSDVISFTIQFSYAFNLWKELTITTDQEEQIPIEDDELNVGHLWITAGIGIMF